MSDGAARARMAMFAGRVPPSTSVVSNTKGRGRAMREASSTHVLLVDSDRVLGETLAVALRRRGFAVGWRPSAEAALASLGEAPWDVVATDLHATGMGGVALC